MQSALASSHLISSPSFAFNSIAQLILSLLSVACLLISFFQCTPTSFLQPSPVAVPHQTCSGNLTDSIIMTLPFDPPFPFPKRCRQTWAKGPQTVSSLLLLCSPSAAPSRLQLALPFDGLRGCPIALKQSQWHAKQEPRIPAGLRLFWPTARLTSSGRLFSR